MKSVGNIVKDNCVEGTNTRMNGNVQYVIAPQSIYNKLCLLLFVGEIKQ